MYDHDDQSPLAGARSSMPQAVVEEIRALILNGTLQPGQRIHQEDMARRLDVSATPVREALRQLAVERFVTVEPHRGVFVAELSADDIEELYVMREALETFAVRLAGPNLSQEHEVRLEDCLNRMQEAARQGAVHDFISADRAFHAVIFGAAHRKTLEAKIFQLWNNTNRVALAMLAHEEIMEIALAVHRDILDACRKRDMHLLEVKSRENTTQLSTLVIDELRTRSATAAPTPLAIAGSSNRRRH